MKISKLNSAQSVSSEAITDTTGAPLVYQPATPGRKAMAETSPRALKFLQAVGTQQQLAYAMKSVGYRLSDHEEGWRLLRQVGGGSRKVTHDIELSEAEKALSVLDAWIGLGFRRAQAALTHMHPEQAAFVLENLRVVRGAEVSVAVATFLERLDALENSTARTSTRKADHAALATLATRGIGDAERKRLAALVAQAQAMRGDAVPPPTADVTKALIALHAWLRDWSEMARTVISNRADLIRMGIGKRRSRGSSVPPGAPITQTPSPLVAAPQVPSASQD